ncbi:hypothetical protein KEJ19_08585, partial [Candidatus Bathyarchaeota archaeon]|nr:hypothetical protein [Candidatus Bathyarchaeota archaeon]
MNLKLLKEFGTRKEFEEAMRDRGIELTDDGVRLTRYVIIADEIGRINSRTFERISGNIWAKKEFWIEDPDVFSAKLCIFNFCEKGDEGAPLYIEVNGIGKGRTVVHRWKTRREYWEDRWAAIPIPVEWLKKGINEFVFHCDKDIVWNLWIDNCRWPNRSAKSIDGGLSWNYERMGFNDSCDGEYVARLWLERYEDRGTITSPVLNLASLAFKGSISPRIVLKSLSLSFQAL